MLRRSFGSICDFLAKSQRSECRPLSARHTLRTTFRSGNSKRSGAAAARSRGPSSGSASIWCITVSRISRSSLADSKTLRFPLDAAITLNLRSSPSCGLGTRACRAARGRPGPGGPPRRAGPWRDRAFRQRTPLWPRRSARWPPAARRRGRPCRCPEASPCRKPTPAYARAMPHHLRPSAAYAPEALLPGDPGHALALAQQLLSQPKMSNHSRGLWGYTGETADGRPLSIQSTGIGGPSAAIVLTEVGELGVRKAIRVGTCGALDPGLSHGDLVVVGEALALDGASRALGTDELARPDARLTEA